MVIRGLALPCPGLADLTTPEYSLPSLVAVVPACCQCVSGLRQHHTSNYTKEGTEDTQAIEVVGYSFNRCCVLLLSESVRSGIRSSAGSRRKPKKRTLRRRRRRVRRRSMKKNAGNRRRDRHVTGSKSSAMHRPLRSSYGLWSRQMKSAWLPSRSVARYRDKLVEPQCMEPLGRMKAT